MFKSVYGYFKTKKKIPMAIKLEGGGGKALMAWPLVEELFFAASLTHTDYNIPWGSRQKKSSSPNDRAIKA